MNKLLILFILLVLSLSCTSTKEDESGEASVFQPVLMEYYGDIIRQNCTFSFETYHRLYRKPEFASLRDGSICEADFEIGNLEFFNADSVKLEFRISYSANRPVLQNFLKAWDDLVKRYETLDSLRIPDHRYGHAWTYLDPADNDMFVRFLDEPGGIFASRQWEPLESVKKSFQELYESRIAYSDEYSVIAVKNGEWKIIQEMSTDGYRDDIHR
jgi:hypothetical protein